MHFFNIFEKNSAAAEMNFEKIYRYRAVMDISTVS
jgi:hypothetical protein